ncbi:MAG: IS21 family transposase [Syntrophomonadales bacterium]
MIRVDQYDDIRQMYLVEGMSQRAIARELGISRNTVRRYCHGANVPWERKPVDRAANIVTPEVVDFIKSCFKEDAQSPNSKQKHTARRIYERLCEEKGFTGGASTIRRAVRELREKQPKVFVPLSFDPGEAIQVDWGQATIILNGVKTQAHIFCMRLSHSIAPFVIAYPTEREESFLEAHIRGFEFFGGVSRDLIYDNLRTAVKEGWGKNAREQDKFAAFRAHYAYRPLFCNPGEGHEKGLVENLVGYARRNFLVPLPEVTSFEELNQLLEQRCARYIEHHRVRGRDMSVKEAFALEKSALLALPVKSYDASKTAEVRVDYFSTARFETNCYSVPVKWVGKQVTVKASGLEVKIYYRGEEIGSHPRSYLKHKTIYQLEHYLPLIEQRPRSVFHARPVKEANIPEQIYAYANRLPSPDKAMVRLLRLMVDYGVEAVLNAVKDAQAKQHYSIDVLQFNLKRGEKATELSIKGPSVNLVDISAYDQLLKGGACM